MPESPPAQPGLYPVVKVQKCSTQLWDKVQSAKKSFILNWERWKCTTQKFVANENRSNNHFKVYIDVVTVESNPDFIFRIVSMS